MKKKIDQSTWERKDHFAFFNGFDEPFFGVCVHIDCTVAYTIAKETGTSFFLYYLYKSLAAANAITPFKYRIEEDNDVVVYDVVNASPTINRSNGTFGFAYIDYHEHFSEFVKQAVNEMERVQNTKGLLPAVSGENVIHYSSIPWINFTALSHARSFGFKDSAPKISFGKMIEEGERKLMAHAVHVHHGLMDGYHVAQYIDLFQQLMNE